MANYFKAGGDRQGVVDLRKISRPKPSSDAKDKPRLAGAPSLTKSSAAEKFLKSSAGDYSRFKHSPKKGRQGILVFLIALLILLIGAAVAGFVFFGPKGGSADSVKVSLATAKSVASGEELGLELTYENIDQVPLKEIEVIFEYPEGFFFERSNLKPTGSEQNIWRLPDLAPGQNGKIEIDGQQIGALDEQKEFIVTFYYQPENFSSTFKTELVTSIKISDVLFEVNVTAPAEISKGSAAQFKVRYKNTTDQTMENMAMIFVLGEKFTLSEAKPSTTDELIWQYEKILPNSQDEIFLDGNYTDESTGEMPWEFKVWQNITKDDQKSERLFYKAAGTVKIVAPDAKVGFEFLNPDSAAWGGNLKCQLVVENSGQALADNLQVKIAFNSSVIDWQKFDNQTGAQISAGTLIWSKDNGDFGKKVQQLKAGASEKLVFELPVIKEPEGLDLLNPEELLVEARAGLTFDFNNLPQSVNADPKTAYLAIQPQLVSEAKYNLDAGTVVDAGPIPPVIGQETQYRIYLKVFSGSRGLSGVEIKTTLPAYINWAGIKDETTLGTPLSYDSASRQVKWQIESLSANTQIMASFNVAVTPTDSQVNQLLILTNPVTLSAQEQVTNNIVSKTTNLLTSDLLGDPVNQGKGRVIVK